MDSASQGVNPPENLPIVRGTQGPIRSGELALENAIWGVPHSSLQLPQQPGTFDAWCTTTDPSGLSYQLPHYPFSLHMPSATELRPIPPILTSSSTPNGSDLHNDFGAGHPNLQSESTSFIEHNFERRSGVTSCSTVKKSPVQVDISSFNLPQGIAIPKKWIGYVVGYEERE
ncbi:hypothetical protein AX16_002543 [Volvariella volvacea WC 439]|nr:hypothetical protein AX16_002543 [Volvariella volvacea WC 439]